MQHYLILILMMNLDGDLTGYIFTGKEYVGISDLDFDEMTLEVVVRFDSITDTNNPTQSVLSNINSGGAGIIFNQLNSTDVSKEERFLLIFIQKMRMEM